MGLKSNGGAMTVSHKSTVTVYHNSVWFSKKVITEIIALKNLRLQYLVTYISNEMLFIAHQDSNIKPNIQFQMHESGLHYFKPRYEDFTLVKTVSENKYSFTGRQIKGAEAARSIYATLVYPSAKYYKWVIQSNHIKNCPVTVQDVDVSQKFWGKDIAALKGKTTQRKSNVVAMYQVKIPVDIMKLHKEVFLTCEKKL